MELLKLIIPGLVLFGVTYWIKDSVDMALHERQLQLDYVKTMGTLAATMQKPTLTPQEATDNAIHSRLLANTPSLSSFMCWRAATRS